MNKEHAQPVQKLSRLPYSSPVMQVYGNLATITATHNNGNGLNDGSGGSSTKNTRA